MNEEIYRLRCALQFARGEVSDFERHERHERLRAEGVHGQMQSMENALARAKVDVSECAAACQPHTDDAWANGWKACVKEHGDNSSLLGDAVEWAKCQPTLSRLYYGESAAAGQQALLVRLYLRSGANL